MTISLPWPFPRAAESEEPSPPLKKSPSSLLHYYATPGISPPSARLDPSLKRRENPPVRFWHVWRYGLIAASKGKYLIPFLSSSYLRRLWWSDSNRGDRRGPLTSHLGSTKKIMGHRNDHHYELHERCRKTYCLGQYST